MGEEKRPTLRDLAAQGECGPADAAPHLLAENCAATFRVH